MPVQYYIIPMVAPPYSRQNPQRPNYVDEIRCNWTGHNVDILNVYICKVNTTPAKHTDLASRAGVMQLPAGITWETPITSLTNPQQNAISNWCSQNGIPYDATETVGEFLLRVINSGLFELGNVAVATQFQNLTQTQRNRITAICAKWGIEQPADTETVSSISKRAGSRYWNPNQYNVEEF